MEPLLDAFEKTGTTDGGRRGRERFRGVGEPVRDETNTESRDGVDDGNDLNVQATEGERSSVVGKTGGDEK